MVQLFYTAYTSIDLAHHEIFRAKVGKGSVKIFNTRNVQFWREKHSKV